MKENLPDWNREDPTGVVSTRVSHLPRGTEGCDGLRDGPSHRGPPARPEGPSYGGGRSQTGGGYR